MNSENETARRRMTEEEKDKAFKKMRRLLEQVAELAHQIEFPPAEFLWTAAGYWSDTAWLYANSRDLQLEDFDLLRKHWPNR